MYPFGRLIAIMMYSVAWINVSLNLCFCIYWKANYMCLYQSNFSQLSLHFCHCDWSQRWSCLTLVICKWVLVWQDPSIVVWQANQVVYACYVHYPNAWKLWYTVYKALQNYGYLIVCTVKFYAWGMHTCLLWPMAYKPC